MIAAEILTRLQADASQFKAEMASASGTTEELGAAQSKMATVGKAAFLGLAGAAVAIAVIGIKAAQEYEVAHAQLTTAVKNSGLVWSEQKGKVEAFDGAMRKLGFTDATTEAALSKAVIATKNMTTAQHEVSVAVDVARARHMDLEGALNLVIKAGNGTYTSLTKLGIATKAQVASFKNGADAVQYLADKFKGQGAAYAETFSGKLAVLQAELEHVAVAIGQKLIPVILAGAGAFASFFTFLNSNREVAIGLAVAIGGPLVAAMGIWIAQMVTAGAVWVFSKLEAAAGFALHMADALLNLGSNVDKVAASYEAEIATELERNGVIVETATASAAAATAEMDRTAAVSESVGASEASTVAMTEETAALEALWAAHYEDAAATQVWWEASTQSIAAQEAEAAAALETAGALQAEAAAASEATLASAAVGDGVLGASAGLTLFGSTMLAGVGIIALGTAAIIGTAYALGYFDDQASKATIAGEKMAAAEIKHDAALMDVIHQHQAWTDSIKINNQELTRLEDTSKMPGLPSGVNRIQAYQAALRGSSGAAAMAVTQEKNWRQEAEKAVAQYDKLTGANNQFKAALDKIQGSYDKAKNAAKAQQIVTSAAAKQMGLDMHQYANDSVDDQKKITKEMADAEAIFGKDAVQKGLWAHMSADAFTAVVKEADKFGKSVASSIDQSVNPFKHFSSQLDVSQGDFQNFFVGSIANTLAWSDEFIGLIHRGVNVGLLQQIAAAGPDAKPLLDQFLAMVDANGVDTVNSWYKSSQDAATAVTNAYAGMAFDVALKAAQTDEVIKAYMADAKTGGSAHLKELASQGDSSLTALAYAAALHLGEVRATNDAAFTAVGAKIGGVMYGAAVAINSVPFTHDVNFSTNLGDVNGQITDLWSALNGLPRTVNIDIIANKAGDAWQEISPFSDRNLKVLIAPVVWDE